MEQTREQRILLIDRGHSPYVIAVAPDAPAAERFAAEELQRYLAAMSGVTLPVEDGEVKKPAIMLGVRAAERLRALPALSEDGYLLRTCAGDLCLCGGSPRATLYAVYHLLERYLGCGWPAPGDDVIPRQETVTLDEIDEIAEPAFTFRSLVHFPVEVGQTLREIDWMAKNRLNWSHPGINGPDVWEAIRGRETLIPALQARGLRLIWGGHTFQTWLPTDRYFSTHPEYFALVDGERRPQENFKGSLCVSNPEMQRTVAENIIAFARQNPEIDVIDLWMNDTTDWCECDACTRLEGEGDYIHYPAVFHAGGKDSRSRAYYRFANAVAKIVRASCPALGLGPLAYFRSFEPPTGVTPEPNLLVGFTNFARNWARSLLDAGDVRNAACEETIRRWRELTEQCFIYEYYSYITVNQYAHTLSTVGQMAEEMRHYRAVGIDKISTEGGGVESWRPLVMYAYARLAWEPELTAEAIIGDFCRCCYGKAAEVMETFWQLHETREPLVEKRPRCVTLLAQAREMETDVLVHARLEKLEAALWQTERTEYLPFE